MGCASTRPKETPNSCSSYQSSTGNGAPTKVEILCQEGDLFNQFLIERTLTTVSTHLNTLTSLQTVGERFLRTWKVTHPHRGMASNALWRPMRFNTAIKGP
jgi:hypothetical protein